jgi:hypothetical protein
LNRRAVTPLVIAGALAACPPPEARLQEAVQALQAKPPEEFGVERLCDQPREVCMGPPWKLERLLLTHASPTRISAEPRWAWVDARVEAEGPLGQVQVRYIGPETITFSYRGARGRYEPRDAVLLTRAHGVLRALVARRAALRAGDFDVYLSLVVPAARANIDAQLRPVLAGRPLKIEVRSWIIRAERETAEAREEYLLDDAGRPVKAAALLKLVRKARDEGWWFSDVGL